MASSTAVDPRQLLNALSSLLTPAGEMKDEEHVDKILSFMKSSRKLVSKCIYMNIIRATQQKPVLMKFLDCGGWEMVNHWLHDGLENENNVIVIEIMKVLKHLPVTIEILKKNDTAKTVKQLSKSDGNELQPIASDLVSCWMKVIKHSPAPDKPVAKKKKLRIKKEDTNGESSEKKSESKEKTEPVKAEEKVKKVGKLKITQIKTGKPVVKLKDDNSPTISKTFDPPKPKKAKVTGPAHAKQRSTGLEMAPPLPKMRIKKKTVSSTSNSTDKKPPSIKREGQTLDKSVQPLEKKVKQESENNTNEAVSPKSKVPPKVNKVHTVHESAGFMDALLAPPTAPIRRKPKKPTVKPTSPKGGPKNAFDASESTAEPLNGKEMKTEAPKIRFYSAGTAEEDESKETEENKSGIKKKKKSVRWKTEENLVSVHYFELDESERVNVNKVSNFADAKRLERESEKEAMMAVKKEQPSDDKKSKGTIEFIPWKRPVKIYIHNAPPEVVCSSQEKETQRQREMAVLQVLFFDKASLPDTPMEPDPEIVEPAAVKRIPLEDESTADEGFDPNTPYDPNENYDPNMVYDMQGQQFDPNLQYDPNQVDESNTASAYDNMHHVLSTLMGQGHEEEEGLTTKLKEIMDTLKGHGGIPPRLPFNPNNPGAFLRPPIRGRGGLLGNVPSFRGPHPPQFPLFPPGLGPGEPCGPPPTRGGMRGMQRGRGMRGGRGARGRGRSEPCWHFMNRGGCRMGNQCHFLHPGINGPPL